MGKPAARMGDLTSHGGTIAAGFPMVLIGGMPAARIGDMHVCPMVTPGVPPIPHVGGPITLGSPMVLIGGMPAARVGDMAVCVGPPDTIAMGCMTVLIGEGGSGSGSGGGPLSSGASSAQAGAVNAMSGNVESTTKEKNWIEFEFIDKAGNVISGVNYKHTDTGKKESSGVLRTDGKVIRDSLAEGECNVVLQSIFNAAWSKDMVKNGDSIDLSVETDGVEEGKQVSFQIFQRDLSGPDIHLQTIDVKVQGNKAKAEWIYKTPPPPEKPGERIKYSSPELYFTCVCGNLKSRSGNIYIEDNFELEVKDEDGNAMADEEYILYLPDGSVKQGKLDGSGILKTDKIPAGVCNVRFPKLSRFKGGKK